MVKDAYLIGLADHEGFVPLAAVATFPKMKELRVGVDTLYVAASRCSSVHLNASNDAIRRVVLADQALGWVLRSLGRVPVSTQW
jgi:hypothetical protein